MTGARTMAPYGGSSMSMKLTLRSANRSPERGLICPVMVSGAWFGLLIGMLLGLFANPDQDPGWATLLLLGLLWGAAFGIVYGLIAHAATRGRRDFSSRSKLEASQYQVTCPVPVAGKARQVLAEMPTTA